MMGDFQPGNLLGGRGGNAGLMQPPPPEQQQQQQGGGGGGNGGGMVDGSVAPLGGYSGNDALSGGIGLGGSGSGAGGLGMLGDKGEGTVGICGSVAIAGLRPAPPAA